MSLYRVEQQVPMLNHKREPVEWQWINFSAQKGTDEKSAELMGSYLQRVGLAGRIVDVSSGKIIQEWKRKV